MHKSHINTDIAKFEFRLRFASYRERRIFKRSLMDLDLASSGEMLYDLSDDNGGHVEENFLGKSGWLEHMVNASKGLRRMIEENHKKIMKLTAIVIPKQQKMEDNNQIKGKETDNVRTKAVESMKNVSPTSYQETFAKKLETLAPEPKEGLLIAVQVPEVGKRMSRKFDPENVGDSVYIWIASRQEVIEKGLKYGGFELVGPQNVILEIGKSLREQNIANRTMFNLRANE